MILTTSGHTTPLKPSSPYQLASGPTAMECSGEGTDVQISLLEGSRNWSESEHRKLEHIQMTGKLDRKESIKEYVGKKVPEPKDQ